MPWKSILGAAAFLAATFLAAPAVAGADDYVFEPVNPTWCSRSEQARNPRLPFLPAR
jgi:hypothetical protein